MDRTTRAVQSGAATAPQVPNDRNSYNFNALYKGYLYGLSFLFNGAFSLVFGKEGHEFGVIGVSLSFLGICVGISAGPLINMWRERYYQPRFVESGGKYIPEARVQLGRLAAIGKLSTFSARYC